MRIAILGAGALGCLFAARLAPLTSVLLLSEWAEAIAYIRQHGIRLLERTGERVVPVPISRDPDEAVGSDLVLILVKSYQTERAAAWAARALSANGYALTLQNGLSNGEVIARHVGPERTLQGVTNEGATLLAPGVVQHGGAGVTTIGRQGVATSWRRAVTALFERGGFQTEWADDTTSLLWGKLVLSAGINPLTTLLGLPNGGLLENDAARVALRQTVSEAAEVARAAGIALPYADAIAQAEALCRMTAANRSSMLQDLSRGRPTEVDAINGAVVRTAARLGQAAPVNQLLWHLIKAREAVVTGGQPAMSPSSPLAPTNA